ncbi:hypothetical protein, partial [Klebsiella pneumoniae]|uniref:hypothetical protein n=1 Tax=Klebsiella pneumoniae TaxID=573 RepID=UPI0024AF9C50
DGDHAHIGVVFAGNNEELNNKIKQAVEAHFDGEITGELKVELDKVYLSYGAPVEFSVEMNEDGDENVRDIEISNTWVY